MSSGTAKPRGSKVGPYTLESAIGHGGMGVVYRASAEDGSEVALKLLSDTVLLPSETARFLREATVRIDHPNCIQVIDAGVQDNKPWLALELLEGETLATRLERGPLALGETIDILTQAAAGVAASHRQGVVHRDLKPSNLFLGNDGWVKLIDFGIAKVTSAHTRLTATGHVLGTPAYLSPEQAHGRPIDAGTDVWALGVVAYEMLTGKQPFRRSSPLATMLAVMIESPPSLRSAVQVPPAVEAIVTRCLLKDPGDRYPNGIELHAAFSSVELAAAEAERMVHQDMDATRPSMPVRSVSITPGEQRLVAVVLAEAVSDLSLVRGAVESMGGSLLSFAGNRAVGLFGGEASEGDEVLRAAQAAFEIRAAARWVAVASGHASYSGATGISGSAVEAAERGCAARVDGVVADRASSSALTGQYRISEVESGIFRLDPRDSHPTQHPAPARIKTVGREPELMQLRLAAERVQREELLSAVIVSGPPGMGKTHLRWELGRTLAELGGFRVLSARAESHSQRAFGLFGSVLRNRIRFGAEEFGWPMIDGEVTQRLLAVRAVVEDALGAEREQEAWDECGVFLAELLEVPVDAGIGLTAARRDPQLLLDRIKLALVDWLHGILVQGPVALLLEDAHWADAASVDLLTDLLDEFAESPFFVFISARPDLLEARPELGQAADAQVLSLRGLSVPECRALTKLIAERELPDELLERLAERTGGNPLFVEQIALAIRESPETLADEAALPLPHTVEAAAQSRLDHLPLEEKEICKRASVFDDVFIAEDFEIFEQPNAKALLQALSRRDVLVGRSRRGVRQYRFRSSLVRDVAHGLMADGVRQDLHRRVAQHLEKSEASSEEIARHWDQGGDSGRALECYVDAAVSASARGDAPAALRCSERALQLGPQGTFELWMARADSFALLGRFEDQGEALANGAMLAQTDAERARAETERAVLLWRTGRREEANRAIDAALGLARSAGEPTVLAKALGRRGAISIYLGELESAATTLAEAEPFLKNAPELLPLHAVWRAQLASARGDLAERRAAYAEAVELFAKTGDVRSGAGAEMNLADAENRVGAYEEAETDLRAVIEKCRRLGKRVTEGYAQTNLGYSLAMQGRSVEALEALEDAEALAHEIGERRLLLSVKLYRARALQDRPQAAVELSAAVAAEASQGGADAIGAIAKALQARALIKVDAEAAAVVALEALAIRDRLGSIEEDEAELFLIAAEALAAAGRTDEAEDTRARGRLRIEEVAQRISDPEWRRRFIEDVAANRALMAP
ncbi:MAG: protein kinase [Myxococcota bacterium]